MKVDVYHYLDSSTTSFEINSYDSVSELKHLIATKLKLRPNQMNLICNRIILDDSKLLSDYNITDGNTIYLVDHFYHVYNMDLLRLYVERVDLEQVEARLKNGLTPEQLNSLGSDGQGIVHVAATKGSTELLHLLHSHGADVNSINGKGESPLFIAIKASDRATAEWLVKNKANVNLTNQFKDTAIHIAARNFLPEMVKFLSAHGAQVDAINAYNDAPVHIAARKSKGSATISALAKAGAKIDIKVARTGETALFFAASKGYLEVVKTLVQLGADPAVRIAKGTSAIDAARKNKSEPVVVYLTEIQKEKQAGQQQQQGQKAKARQSEASVALMQQELEELRAQKAVFTAQQKELAELRSQNSEYQSEIEFLKRQLADLLNSYDTRYYAHRSEDVTAADIRHQMTIRDLEARVTQLQAVVDQPNYIPYGQFGW